MQRFDFIGGPLLKTNKNMILKLEKMLKIIRIRHMSDSETRKRAILSIIKGITKMICLKE